MILTAAQCRIRPNAANASDSLVKGYVVSGKEMAIKFDEKILGGVNNAAAAYAESQGRLKNNSQK